MRAHYRAPVQDGLGNLQAGAVISVYVNGTTTPPNGAGTLISAPVYADGSSLTTLGNPFTTPDGNASFYLDAAQRVDLGILPPGGQLVIFPDIDISEATTATGTITFVGSGLASTQVGNASTATQPQAVALGDTAAATGPQSTAAGQQAGASASGSAAYGQVATASGANSTAIGQGSSATASGATALGRGAGAAGQNSTALGAGATASGTHSTAIGQGAVANANNQVVIGTAADTVSIPGTFSPGVFSPQTIGGVTQAGSPSGDATGVTDLATLNAAISRCPAGGTLQLVGAYQISSPLSFSGITISGFGTGSSITQGSSWSGSALLQPFGGPVRVTNLALTSTSTGIVDFQNANISQLEIDHCMLTATGGHVFSNANLHQSSMHHCTFTQNSFNYGIWNMNNGLTTPGSGLSTTNFDNCIMNVQCNTSGVRSVAAFSLFITGNKNIDNLYFTNCHCFNNVNAGTLDNSQYFFDIACTSGLANQDEDSINFVNVDFGRTLGGAIRLQSVQGAKIRNVHLGNVFTQDGVSVAAPLISVGTFTGGQPSSGILIDGLVREGTGPVGSGSSWDFQCSSDTTNVTIITPTVPDSARQPVFSFNNAAGVTVIGASSGSVFSGTASDFTQIGGGVVKVGTKQLGPLANVQNTKPANPAATTSAANVLVMMGLGVTYTPIGTGAVKIDVTGSVFTTVAAVTGNYGGRYGTGTAPVNNAAVTGTRFGAAADPSFRAPVVGSTTPAQFALTDIITGLTPGTTYWFDLALSTSNASDPAQMQNISISIMEVS